MVVAPQNIEDISNNSINTIDSALVGLDYIVENSDYVEKLVSALDSDNYVVKKQVFELLSALCVYNAEGYNRTFECLDLYKEKTGERYRYKFVVRELQNTTSGEYQTAILAFINCLILSTQDIRERIRIRSEFIGLKLLHVLYDLRNKSDADLVVQLDVFDEQKESDESQVDPNSNGIDLSSPLEVFDAILRQISDTPQEIPFLCVLQHLLRIESKEAISDIIWDAVERLVHRATLLESREDALRLFKTQSHAKSLSKLKGSTNVDRCTCQCHQKCDRRGSSTTNIISTDNIPASSSPLDAASPPLPPPPQPPQLGPPPPPPNAPPNLISTGHSPNPNLPKLPQQTIPTPKTKMRTINWNKISSGQVLEGGNQNNLWATFAKTHSNTPISLDWGTLEGLFCLPNEKNLTASTSGNNKSSGVQLDNNKLISKREANEVILLDAKRSLNINIFLKQFRRSNEEMIKLIQNGCSEDFGSEKLRGLLKILPLKEEIEMLKSVSASDTFRLASAEKFLLRLIQVSNYQLRIEAMLFKEELDSCVNNVESSINAIFQAAQDVKNSVELQEVIFMILVAGNFLNSGGYAGDAAGLKLSSLQKIADIRGNKPGISLLHFIAMQAETKNSRLISFVNDLMTLEEASKSNTEQLKSEIMSLKSKVTKINQQLGQADIPQEICQQFSQFFRDAARQVESLETSFNEIEKVRIEMAHFFCEEVSSFKLEDCFKILLTFTSTWKLVANENNRRRVLEKEVEARRLMREAQLKKRQQLTPPQKSTNDGFSKKHFTSGLNQSIEEIVTSSPRIPNRRVDYNGNTNNNQGSTDQLLLPSPDITPNGSLRRRRSRQPSDESETGLMGFLRASGGDISRERRGPAEPTGSLERNWSRNSRRRPNLAEFINYDRERPVSPSPSDNGSPVIQIENPENSSNHDLRERISAWFVDLEGSGNADTSKRRANIQRAQRKYSNEFGDEVGPGGLSTLIEAETTEEDNPPAKPICNGRRPSLKLNADVVGAMEAIEEAQGPLKDTKLWRRQSLTFANEESLQDNQSHPGSPKRSDADEVRRSLIGSLGAKSQNEKLVLYIPQRAASPTPPTKTLFRHGSTGEEDILPQSQPHTNGNVFGTEEGFNRFASIRRSRKFRQGPEPPSPRNSKHKFITKVDIVGEQATRNVEAKLVNETAAGKLKALFGQGRQRSDTKSVHPLNRSTSLESNNSRPPIKGIYNHRTKVNSSFHGSNERDEGFEESQSLLSETNSHAESANVSSSGRPDRPNRRGGFREGREAVSTRSIVAAQREALKLEKQSQLSNSNLPAATTSSTASSIDNKSTPKNSSRSSLLSSRSSLTSQSTVREAKPPPLPADAKSKSIKPISAPKKLTRSISTTSSPLFLTSSRPNGLIRTNSKMEKASTDNNELKYDNVKNSSPQVPVQANKKILSFMRPTASSSARDKVEPSTTTSSTQKKGIVGLRKSIK